MQVIQGAARLIFAIAMVIGVPGENAVWLILAHQLFVGAGCVYLPASLCMQWMQGINTRYYLTLADTLDAMRVDKPKLSPLLGRGYSTVWERVDGDLAHQP